MEADNENKDFKEMNLINNNDWADVDEMSSTDEEDENENEEEKDDNDEKEEDEKDDNDGNNEKDEQRFILEYGDVIYIVAPPNELLHENTFFVYFIDEERIVMKNIETKSEYVLTLTDGSIDEETVEEIRLVSRSKEKGFVKQHALNIGDWLNIYFGGVLPSTITCVVKGIEYDMLELELYPQLETIFIDFQYKGIPIELNIEKIEIRDDPTKYEPVKTKRNNVDRTPKKETTEQKYDDSDSDDDKEESKQKIDDVVDVLVEKSESDHDSDNDEYEIGEDLGIIEQIIDLNENEKRYFIDIQTDDLLNDILSHIPTVNRDRSAMKNVQKTVQRFRDLHELYSVKDDRGVVTKSKRYDEGYRKLYSVMSGTDTNSTYSEQLPGWLLPVVRNTKHIYHVSDEDLVAFAMEYDDIVLVNHVTDYEEFQSYEKKYKDNVSNGVSRYRSFVDDITRQNNPYRNPSNSNKIITSLNYGLPQESVVSNDEPLISSCLDSDGRNIAVKPCKNYVAKYDSERMFIESFLVLPSYTVPYANRCNPYMTIEQRVLMNKNPTMLYSVLDKGEIVNHYKTPTLSEQNVEDLEEDDYDDEVNENTDVFMSRDKIVRHRIRDRILSNNDLEDVEKERMIYDDFVPHIIDNYNDIKSYIQKSTSRTLYTLSKELDTFGFELEFIKKKDYIKLKQNVQNYARKYRKSQKNTLFYSKKLSSAKLTDDLVANNLKLLFSNTKHSEVLQLYDVNTGKLNNSEILSRCMMIDNANLFFNGLVSNDEDLYSDMNIRTVLETKMKEYEEKPKNLDDEKCKKLRISKEYTNEDTLIDDNGKSQIFYDMKYDETRYEINDLYKKQEESMNAEEYKNFLVNQLIETVGLNQEDADLDSDAMIMKKRLVREGDYAIVVNEGNDKQYYKRVEEQWELDETVDGVLETKLFCNSRESCVEIKDECKAMSVVEDENEEKMTESILKDVIEYNENERVLTKEVIQNDYTSSVETYRRLMDRHIVVESRKCDMYRRVMILGDNTSLTNSLDESPNEMLKSLILGEKREMKRMELLSDFIKKFVREPLVQRGEDQHWLYCIFSNTKLLPSFYKRLVKAYNISESDYQLEVEKVCKDRGKKSEEGDQWVDKYSGSLITYIGYIDDELARPLDIQSHEMDRVSDEIVQMFLNKDKKYSGDVDVILNVIVYLSESIGVNIRENYPFIIRRVLQHLKNMHGTKDQFKRRLERLNKDNKKLNQRTVTSKYENKKKEIIILFVALYTLFVIQTAVPAKHTKKTFPNCIRSFSGFPIDMDGEDTGLKYLVCVIKKVSRTGGTKNVWSSAKTMKPEVIESSIKTLYKKVVSGDEEIKHMIKKRREYDFQQSQQQPLERINQIHWNFRPYQHLERAGVIKKPLILSKQFVKNFMDAFKKGRKEQFEYIAALESKQEEMSTYIQHLINEVVKKEEVYLQTIDNEPFLENVCCGARFSNENENMVIQYFGGKQKRVIDVIKEVADIQQHVKYLTNLNKRTVVREHVVESHENDKVSRNKTTLSSYNIHVLFFKLCSYYRKKDNINSSVQSICQELGEIDKKYGKNYTDNENDNTSDNLYNFKVDKLNSNNYVVQENVCLDMLRQFHRENHLQETAIASNNTSWKIRLQNAFVTIRTSGEGETIMSDDEIQVIMNVFTTNATDISVMNMIVLKLNQSKENVHSFFAKYIGDFLNVKVKNHIMRMVESGFEIGSFRTREDSTVSEEEYNGIHNIDLLRRMIDMFAITLPLNVSNEFPSHYIPKHWGFSSRHVDDIIKVLERDSELVTYQKHTVIHKVFEKIRSKLKQLVNIVHNLPRHLGKNLMEFNVIFHRFVFFKCIEEFIDEGVANMDAESENLSRPELISTISEFIGSFFKFVYRDYHVSSLSEDKIKDRMIRLRDDEKNQKTRALGKMTQAQRTVDTVLKGAKLGKYNVGLQKGLREYDKDFYQRERDEMEHEMKEDLIHGQLSDLNQELVYMFGYENIQQPINEGEYEDDIHDMNNPNHEAYNMENVVDDDDGNPEY